MAKGDQENTMGAIAGQRTTDQQQINPYMGYTANRIGTRAANGQPGTGLQGQQEQQLGTVSKGYAGFAGTGGVGKETANALGTGPTSIANGIATPDYSAPMKGYGDMAATGGVDVQGAVNTFGQQQNDNPDIGNSIKGLGSIDYSGVDAGINRLKYLSTTGGFTDADKANILRPLYYENEQTGGYTDPQLANIKKESNAVVPSYYSTLQDQMARSKATSGYGPGFSDANQALTRQGAVASGNQALNTDVSLAESVRQGKMDAANAIQRGQLGISGIANPIMEQSAAGAASAGLNETGQKASNFVSSGNLANEAAQIKLAAANGDIAAQKLVQSGKLAGLGGEADITTAMNQADLNKAKLVSSNVTNLAGMQQQGKEFGVSGQGALYNSTTNQLSDEEKNYLTSLGLSASQQAQLLQIMSGTAQQPGSTATGFNNLFKGISTGAGALSGLGVGA